MKKSDYNRVMSLYKNSEVEIETCIQLLIQLSKDSAAATRAILKFLNEIEEISHIKAEPCRESIQEKGE